MSTPTTRSYGAQSMTAPLRRVLVNRPGAAFGAGFDRPEVGFLHRVDLAEARRQHDALCGVLAGLGCEVDVLDGVGTSPDAVYTFDPLLVSEAGAIPLRSGKPSRQGEEAGLEAWALAAGIPVAGRIEPPGTVDGGDTFWLRPDLLLHRPLAAHEPARAPISWRPWPEEMSACSTSPTRPGRPSACTCCR